MLENRSNPSAPDRRVSGLEDEDTSIDALLLDAVRKLRRARRRIRQEELAKIVKVWEEKEHDKAVKERVQAGIGMATSGYAPAPPVRKMTPEEEVRELRSCINGLRNVVKECGPDQEPWTGKGTREPTDDEVCQFAAKCVYQMRQVRTSAQIMKEVL